MRFCTFLFLAACIEQPGSGELAATRIVTTGFFFGECGGYCSGTLAIDGASLTLTLTSNTGGSDVVNLGALTATGHHDLAAATMPLGSAALAETFGCPDCNDGGASFLELVVDGRSSMRTTWPSADPPAVLATVDAVLDDLLGALRTCTASSRTTLIACTPQ